MNKKIFPIFLTTVLLLAGCGSKIENQPPENQSSKDKPKTVQADVDPNKEPEESNTSDWAIYRNEKYGFEVEYPKDWYWKDYTKDFGRLMIGFYPKEKKKGWEYLGDIQVHILEKTGSENLIEHYEKSHKIKFEVSDKVKKMKSKNDIEAIAEYDVKGNIDLDTIIADCGSRFVYFDSPANSSREILDRFVDSLICF